ncbi:MAG: TM1812 family CRISPR-associated protein [Eubacteriales bacterium]|nr:TM1812 family CRISPR-associated protein [Eubacteriales bacterium]
MGKSIEKKGLRTEENVLLLSMSILPKNRMMNHYRMQDQERTYHFNGITQLEAGTKYVLSKLAAKGQKVSRIIILASDETQIPEENYDNFTAVDFYKERIKDFITGTDGHTLGLENKVEEFRFTRAEYYPDPEKLFQIIKTDANKNTIYFWHAVEAIRGVDRTKKINLYMDMQGGDRSAIAQMNAIVELLKDQNVTIRGRYATEFNPANAVQPMSEVSESYRTYELMTAMQVFKNYGWGQELVNYFGTQESERDKKLVEAIQKASDAIRMSDVGGFDQAVTIIQELSKEFGDHSQPADEKTQLDIVFEDILEDYRPLIENSRYRYIEQIRWCLKKGFLQQALTILEAKMPYEYVNNGLIYYCDQNDDRKNVLGDFAKIYKKYKCTAPYKMKDLNHYFIRYYLVYDTDFEGISISAEYGCDDLENRIENSLSEYRCLCCKRNMTNHAASSASRNKDGFFYYMQSKYPKDRNWKDSPEDGSGNLKKRIENFLAEFTAIADEIKKKNPELRVVDLS